MLAKLRNGYLVLPKDTEYINVGDGDNIEMRYVSNPTHEMLIKNGFLNVGYREKPLLEIDEYISDVLYENIDNILIPIYEISKMIMD